MATPESHLSPDFVAAQAAKTIALQMLEERGRGAVLVGVARVDAALEHLLQAVRRERFQFPDVRAAVRLDERGDSVAELAPRWRDWNARACADGSIELDIKQPTRGAAPTQ